MNGGVLLLGALRALSANLTVRSHFETTNTPSDSSKHVRHDSDAIG